MGEQELASKAAHIRTQVAEAKANREALARENANLIAEFRETVAKARGLREKKSGKAGAAKQLVSQKNLFLEKLSLLRKQLGELNELRGKLAVNESFSFLKKKVDALEWTLQTEALSPEREKKLSSQITSLRKQLEPAQKLDETREKIGALVKEKNNLLEQLRGLDGKIRALFSEADRLRKDADSLSRKADALSKKIGANLGLLGEKSSGEQALRNELGSVRGELHALERQERQKIVEKERLQREGELSSLRKQAGEINSRLRAGKKISLLEMQVLAQAGV